MTEPQGRQRELPVRATRALAAKKLVTFSGVYGTIDDPEKVVDAMFAKMKTEAEKDRLQGGKLVGSPKAYTPAGFDDARHEVPGDQGRPTSAESGKHDDQHADLHLGRLQHGRRT